jgi:hypothetical protein
VQEAIGSFFGALQQNAGGISVLIFSVASLAVIALVATQWLSWIRRWGRFRPPAGAEAIAPITKEPSSIAHLIMRFFTTIISEFRHLLALLIFLLFAGVLTYSVIVASRASANTAEMIDSVSTVIQAVVASLGGLVGSIIGYYFGESTARSARQELPPPAPSLPGVQTPSPGAAAPASEGVRPASQPPQ